MKSKFILAGCAIVQDGKLLLLHRIKRNCYELPGGKVDQGETPEQAAIRELKEELLCDVEISRKLGQEDFEEDGYEMSYVWFLAKIKSGEPKVGEPDKFSHLKFIPLSDLDSFELSSNMKNFLSNLKSEKFTL